MREGISELNNAAFVLHAIAGDRQHSCRESARSNRSFFPHLFAVKQVFLGLSCFHLEIEQKRNLCGILKIYIFSLTQNPKFLDEGFEYKIDKISSGKTNCCNELRRNFAAPVK